MAEALAAEFGVQIANQLDTPRVVLEVDSLCLVRHMQEEGEPISEMGIICRNIKKLLRRPGSAEGAISHIRREANQAAHIMAHSKTNWEMREVWLDRAPVFLLDQLRLDDVAIDLI
ncbi:unnamed protein product [Linum tenue]|uniref:RNase H type-1 domain-containing protein n=2 Tax=Linum tenue TaxID=586396 RepID=A0AAV0P2U1_9ROSI|nr:unnamed protein product [Linum tenue]